MTLETLSAALREANVVLLVVLALLALREARRRGRPAARWFAATFGALALLFLTRRLLPEEPDGAVLKAIERLAFAVGIAFPYFLYRFAFSFGPASVARDRLVGAATALIVAVTMALPSFPFDADPRPLWFRIYVFAALAYVILLSALVAVRLWRAGRGQPTPARYRMRTLSAASLLLSVALLLGAAVADEPPAVETTFRLLLVISAVLFFVGFSPPRLLRMAWRRGPNDALRRAMPGLVAARTQQQVAADLLPHATNIVGGRGAALIGDRGEVIGAHGLTSEDVEAVVRANPDDGRSPAPLLRIPLKSGWLVVWTTPYSPYFGSEERELLESLGTLVELAVERVRTSEREQQLAVIVNTADDAVMAASPEGTVTAWNPGAERLYGYAAEEIVGSDISILVPPEARGEEREILGGAISEGRVRHYEVRRVRKDGALIDVSLVVSPMRDAAGTIVGASAVARDVTERRAADQALRAAKEAAERANEAKSEFMSRMSHELRTPMTAILGFSELLEADGLTTERQRDCLGHILTAGRHLLELINELLDISRIESGTMTISPEPVRLKAPLDEAIDLVKPSAAGRRIRLSLHTDGLGERYVLVDRQRVKQVLLNLLSNAIKYNAAAGEVVVRCAEAPADRLRVEILDTGRGIAPERMAQLFEPFERLGAEDLGVEGTGLGLAVSKRLVELMGGEIGARSEPGRGSAFWLELPTVEAPVAALDRGREELPDDVRSSGRRRTVLYIEDNAVIVDLVRLILGRRPDVELVAATHGAEGLELAHELRPDLVLLDLDLPDIGGDEALRRLHGDPDTAGIPVVVISADATEGRIRRLCAAGAADYVTKPLDVKRFLEVVDLVLDE